ncbi:hypothetical protein JCM10296v2_005246 [Rhodotorula toruloides]|uniref:Uncharacterized protein n=1 Tax=Rhodotorula toruloides TaxID=5286 RepID=A0A0K3C8A2_RHOTO|nr:hypothetical protein RTBOTA2_004343 [Rhodotorula toruloides]PRQ78076.1 hypothetical protein AAT19DRAFT_9144 [Rhodotorula toruloides]
MPVFSWVAGFGAVGFITRMYALGIQKRPLFDNLGGHALSSLAWGGFGYWAYYANERNAAQIEERKQQMARIRAREELPSGDEAEAGHH